MLTPKVSEYSPGPDRACCTTIPSHFLPKVHRHPLSRLSLCFLGAWVQELKAAQKFLWVSRGPGLLWPPFSSGKLDYKSCRAPVVLTHHDILKRAPLLGHPGLDRPTKQSSRKLRSGHFPRGSLAAEVAFAPETSLLVVDFPGQTSDPGIFKAGGVSHSPGKGCLAGGSVSVTLSFFIRKKACNLG